MLGSSLLRVTLPSGADKKNQGERKTRTPRRNLQARVPATQQNKSFGAVEVQSFYIVYVQLRDFASMRTGFGVRFVELSQTVPRL